MKSFPEHWDITELHKVNIEIIDGDRGVNYPKQSEFFPEGYCLFLNTGNIKEDKFVFVENNFVSEERDHLLRKGKLKRKDIVLSTRGTVGSVGYYKLTIPYEHMRINSGMVIMRCGDGLDTDFVYQLLKSPFVKEQYKMFSSGSAQPQLPIKDLRRIPLLIPPLPIQQKIAAILSAYDDLIENNNKRIALLETAAQEIYREWFVRMRFPGWAQTKFTKGVPEDWEYKPMKKLVEFNIGGGWGEEKSSLDYSADAYVIRGTDLPSINSGDFSKDVYRYHKPSNFKSRKMKSGDIIFEVAGGSKDQWLGRTALMTDDVIDYFEDKVICASFCKLIRFDKNIVSPYFMKYFFNLYYSTGLVGTYQVQSTGISNYQFESFLIGQQVLIPTDNLINAFDEQVLPLIKQKDKLSLANIRLKESRNLLLSRLISGKLPVDNLDIHFPPSMSATPSPL